MAAETETPKPLSTRRVDLLEVRVYQTREEAGRAAAQDAGAYLRARIGTDGSIRVAFASAPSQNEFLHVLETAQGIDWTKVTAFHLDEYVGLPADAPQAFGQFLRERLFNRVRPGMVHFLDGNAPSLEEECARYAGLLAEAPLDLACIGVGENGHIAFNDPAVAHFADPILVRVVALDPISRQQQVHDGCFSTLDDVPRRALTLTVPAIFGAARIICVVPSRNKASAVKRMLSRPVSTECPASILRRHPNATLYLDLDSASDLSEGV